MEVEKLSNIYHQMLEFWKTVVLKKIPDSQTLKYINICTSFDYDGASVTAGKYGVNPGLVSL